MTSQWSWPAVLEKSPCLDSLRAWYTTGTINYMASLIPADWTGSQLWIPTKTWCGDATSAIPVDTWVHWGTFHTTCRPTYNVDSTIPAIKRTLDPNIKAWWRQTWRNFRDAGGSAAGRGEYDEGGQQARLSTLSEPAHWTNTCMLRENIWAIFIDPLISRLNWAMVGVEWFGTWWAWGDATDDERDDIVWGWTMRDSGSSEYRRFTLKDKPYDIYQP